MLDQRLRSVSVVIATHAGSATLSTAIRSLARQTLAPDRFEILVVQKDFSNVTTKALDDIRREFPDLILRRLAFTAPGLALARNVAMAAARGEYVTFVDDDDTVSPRYLEGLLKCSGPDTVGVAHLADVIDSCLVPDFDNRLARQLALAGHTMPPGNAISAMTYSVGKMLPTELARAVGFDPQLRSGEDIVFYLRFFMAYPLALNFVPLDEHAVYYRAIVPGSLSRQPLSYDFNVSQRLDVMEQLEALEPTEPWHHIGIRDRTRAQTRRINEYLRVHPERLGDVLADIRGRGLEAVPFSIMTAGVEPATTDARTVRSGALALVG